MLEIRLLGQFELRVDGVVQVLPSRAAQSLLAYLVLHAGTPQRREHLAGLLWPDHLEISARRNLRTALWHIRKVLGDDPNATDGFILSSNITTTFNADSDYWLDAAALEMPADAERTSGELAERVSLYRSELLPGFYDDWVVLERDRLEGLYEAMIQRLLHLLLAEERWSDALTWSGRWIALGRAPEPAYRAQMTAHAGLGDLPSLAEAYNRCLAALLEDLGVTPSAETRALYEALIRGGSPASVLPQPARASRQPAALTGPAPAPGEPPFLGLRNFEEADAGLFFGREALIAKLIERLEADPALLVIVGASGSGKSSVLRAGLIPALKDAPRTGGLAGPGGWQVHLIKPTAHPLEALATSLTRDAASPRATEDLIEALQAEPRSLAREVQRLVSAGRQRILLAVDQFEELFTLCQSEAEGRSFVENLLAATGAGIPLTVLIALRADFYAHCGQYPALREALTARQEYIGPMNAGELRRAIEGPAERGGWLFSPELVELMLHDAGEEPGSLPLLSHALLETWKRREGRTLTLAGYAAAGGVRGAIARTAERVYQGLGSGEQALARSTFLRLTALGEGTQDTRRRATLSELIPAPELAPLVQDVLHALVGARLITMGDDEVEVAHEALIREWPTLRRWLAEDREGLRLHRRLTAAAQEWEGLDRDPSLLYRGMRIQQATEWAGAHGDQLNEVERAFLQAAQAHTEDEAAEREAQRQRELESSRQLALVESERAEAERRSATRVRRAARYLAVALAAAVLLAAAALFLGFQARSNQAAATLAREQAEAQRRLATSRELAAAAVTNLEADPERSILLAREAINATYRDDGASTAEAETALHQALARSRLIRTLRHGDASPLYKARFSPDGRQIATVGVDTVVVWDVATWTPAYTLPGHEKWTSSVDFSPDGRYIVTGDASSVIVWDVAGAREAGVGQRIQTLRGHPPGVGNAIFDPSGQLLASAGDDRQVILWDWRSGKALHRFMSLSGGNPSYALAFSPDGLQLAAGGADNTARIYDVASGEERAVLRGHTDIVMAAAFSPDGLRLVTGGTSDNAGKVWDVATGREIASLVNHRSMLWDAMFSPDGEQILTASFDGTARVWESESGRELFALAGHEAPVHSAAFSPSGMEVATAGEDGTARIWSVRPPSELGTIQAHTGYVLALALSPDGQTAATAGQDGMVRLWDVATGKETLTLAAGMAGAPQFAVAFSPDGKRLAASGQELEARVWDLPAGGLVLSLRGHATPLEPDDWLFLGIQSITYSPDGTLLATAGADGTARIWDANTGEQLSVLAGHTRRLNSVAFSPDGKQVATGSDDATARVWDVASGALLWTLRGHASRVWAAEFSPDGKRLATGGRDAMLKVWDVATGQELMALAGHTAEMTDLAFSPDGTRLASAAGDSTARVWDAANGRELVTLDVGSSIVWSPVFSPDGNHLFVGTSQGLVRAYTLQLDELMRLAKERVTRGLTDEECRKYLHLQACPPPDD
jgi:WD40 repeat protein/DNA-binding SARP family transcriptional activator